MGAARAEGPGQPRQAARPLTSRTRVVSEGANPTVRQRELGMRLRELRDNAGLNVEDVGLRLECSASKISRMETGSRRASPRDVRDLCVIYGLTDQAQVDELMDLARLAREPGWWSQYDEPVLSPCIGLEQEAVVISAYSMYFVPALLQTNDYARITIRGIERKMDPAVLDQRVEARLRRQELLNHDQPPRYRVLLVKCAAEEKVTVQVIPFNVGAHASTDSNFVLLEFGDSSLQQPVVFVEGLFSNRYQERKAEIDRYREALEYLRDAGEQWSGPARCRAQ